MNEETKERAYESENLNELFTALAKAQLSMNSAFTDSTNPFFKSKYADLTSVVNSSRCHLTTNGLCVVQRIMPVAGASCLVTRLGHASGQWMESVVKVVPPKADIQSFGSYITYLRRYSYSSMVGVVTSDDDAEMAMERNCPPVPTKEIVKAQPLPTDEADFISEAEAEYIDALIDDKDIEYRNDLLALFAHKYKMGKISCFTKIPKKHLEAIHRSVTRRYEGKK